MDQPMIDKFREHNRPLRKQMLDAGHKWVEKDHLAFFENSEGKYEPFPPGYITGPCTYGRGGFYVSIRLKSGAWTQRRFGASEQGEASEWALGVAKEQLI